MLEKYFKKFLFGLVFFLFICYYLYIGFSEIFNGGLQCLKKYKK
jgi:hypothetical protein